MNRHHGSLHQRYLGILHAILISILQSLFAVILQTPFASDPDILSLAPISDAECHPWLCVNLILHLYVFYGCFLNVIRSFGVQSRILQSISIVCVVMPFSFLIESSVFGSNPFFKSAYCDTPFRFIVSHNGS